jgi:hypothetical protein
MSTLTALKKNDSGLNTKGHHAKLRVFDNERLCLVKEYITSEQTGIHFW